MNIKLSFYKEFDVAHLMPPMWQHELTQAAKQLSRFKLLVPTSVTSREVADSAGIETYIVDGLQIKHHLPWLYAAYHTTFLEMANIAGRDGPYLAAKNDLYGVNLNVLKGTGSRYESHVDSNPLQGLLFVTEHNTASGGVLRVSCNQMMKGEFPLDSSSFDIQPEPGKLLFFDARRSPHYVTPLLKGDLRVTVAMNFYCQASPESLRPKDLNNHLF